MHRNMIGMQRATLVRMVGIEVQELYRDGYGVDGDVMLDSLNERRETWDDGWTDDKGASS